MLGSSTTQVGRWLFANGPTCLTLNLLPVYGFHDHVSQHVSQLLAVAFVSSQKDTYHAVARDVLQGVFQGVNGTVLCYGQVT